MVVLWVNHLILAEMFSGLRKNKVCSVGGDAWICWKALQRGLSSCPLWPLIKIFHFSSGMKNSECLHALSDYVPGYGPNWLVKIAVSHGMDLSKKFECSFLLKTIRVMLTNYLHNHKWTHPTLFQSSVRFSHWHPNIVKSLYCSLPSSTACSF